MADEQASGANVSVGRMTNSVIQQNSPGAVASIRVLTGEEKSKVEEILKGVAELVDFLPLNDDDKEEMKDDIATAEAQLNVKKPKAGTIKTCLNSLLRSLTAATTVALAPHVASGVQWAIDHISAIVGGM